MATPSPTPPAPSQKRELDITEVGLLGNAPKKVKSETQVRDYSLGTRLLTQRRGGLVQLHPESH